MINTKYHRSEKRYLLLFLLTLSLLLSSCQSGSTSSSGSELPVLTEMLSSTAFILDTFVSIRLYDRGDEALIQECFDLCHHYEDLFSRTIETSDIGRINTATRWPVTVSEETADLLVKALYYSELSDGAFDLTIASVSSLWDFSGLEPVRPSDDAIQTALPHVDYRTVSLRGCEVTVTDPDAAIDLGAIAKGYIADRLKEHLISRGVTSAIIDLGGNILCIGGKSTGGKAEPQPFRLGVQKPFEDRSETIAAMEISDMSVVSSGIYERCFWEGDTLYHHILDPNTGYPYDNGLISVTIVSPHSVDGDALSTTCFALGLEKGMELIDSLPDTWAIFITEDYELHYSEGFQENITLIEQ